MRHGSTSGVIAWAFSLSAAAAAGCSAGAESTGPAAASGLAGALPPGLFAGVEFERRLDEGAPDAPRASLTARVAGAAVRSAALRAPSRRVYPLEPDKFGASVVLEAESDVALLEEFPHGTYVFDMTLADGSMRSIAIAVRGGFPAFPAIIDPADGETGVGLVPTFSWRGEARRYDVGIVAEATGARTEIAHATDLLSTSPGAPLEPGAAYTLEVSAESGPPSGAYEFESTRSVRFRTGDR